MLNSLLGPLLLATSLFIGVAVVDRKTVVLQDIPVPASVRNAGYPPQVVGARLSDAMTNIEREARTRPEGQRLVLESDKGPIDLIGGYFHLTPIVQAMQDATGMLDWTVRGEIVELGDRLEFRVRVRERNGTSRTFSVERPKAEVDALITDAATRVLMVTDPHIVCSGLLVRAIQRGDGNYDTARDCMYAGMADAEMADRIWLINMQGVIRYLRNDSVGALHAFARVLRLDPDFSPTLLNLGVLFAEAGRHDQAIKAFRQSFARVNFGDSPQTYAATLVEWGDSLLALGQRDAALAKYEEATQLDPRYPRSFLRWAEVLGSGKRADELRRIGFVSAREANPVYVENLVDAVRQVRDQHRSGAR